MPMRKRVLTSTLALAVATGGLGATVATPAFAKHGADDAPGHVRHGKGADDPKGKRTSKGADDAKGHKRHGADDAPGHKRHGGDDAPGHH